MYFARPMALRQGQIYRINFSDIHDVNHLWTRPSARIGGNFRVVFTPLWLVLAHTRIKTSTRFAIESRGVVALTWH